MVTQWSVMRPEQNSERGFEEAWVPHENMASGWTYYKWLHTHCLICIQGQLPLQSIGAGPVS